MSEFKSNAAQAGVETISRAGISAVFGNPGTTELPLMQALSRHPEITYYLGLHEGVSVGMAAGYAAASGTIGVVMLHATPGVSNGLSNYYNAYRNGLPVLMISGQSDRGHQFLDPMLYGNLEQATAPYSKWTWEARTAEEIPAIMGRAICEAVSAPTGPTFLSLPLDLQLQDLPGAHPVAAVVPRCGPALQADIAKCVELLMTARSPAIVAGDLIGRERCGDRLAEFATEAAVAAYWEPMSHFANFPAHTPAFQGVLFPSGEDFRRVFAEHDVVLWCGSDLRAPLLYDGSLWHGTDSKVIVLSDHAGGINNGFLPELAMVGNPRATIEQMIMLLQSARYEASVAKRDERRAKLGALAAERRAKILAAADKRAQQSPLAPVSVIARLLSLLPTNAIVVDDAVSNSGWVSLCGQYQDEVAYLGPSKGGGIGFGLPVALGAQVAHPQRPVVAFIGDGAAMYSIQGLWTAAHYKLPIIFVILNNSSYRILKGGLATMFGDTIDSDSLSKIAGFDLNNPQIDFVALATSLGIEAVRAETLDACTEAMRAALDSKRPWLLEISVERDVRKVLR